MADTGDMAIYMFFSRQGKLFLAAPHNLPSFKQARFCVVRVEKSIEAHV